MALVNTKNRPRDDPRADVAGRMKNEVQISSDALAAYTDAVERAFGGAVNYGQISKTYSLTSFNKEAAARYSPCEVVKVEKTVVQGMPDVNRITTSHVEMQDAWRYPHDASAGRWNRSECVDRCGTGRALWGIKRNTSSGCRW